MKLEDFAYALIGVIASAKEENSEAELKEAVKQDLLERVEERKKRQESRLDNFKKRGTVLAINADVNILRQGRCNHLKGGPGYRAITEGRGDDTQYAVIKHKHRNGDVHVHCLRCGRVWTPGDPDHSKAIAFPTRNVDSSDAVVCTVLNGGAFSPEFAETWRKWARVPAYKGFSSSPWKDQQEGNAHDADVTKLEKQAEPEKITRPVTFKKEYVPTVTITTSPAHSNLTVKSIQNVEPNVS